MYIALRFDKRLLVMYILCKFITANFPYPHTSISPLPLIEQLNCIIHRMIAAFMIHSSVALRATESIVFETGTSIIFATSLAVASFYSLTTDNGCRSSSLSFSDRMFAFPWLVHIHQPQQFHWCIGNKINTWAAVKTFQWTLCTCNGNTFWKLQ